MPLTPDSVARLLREVEALVAARLPGPLRTLFDAADDSLFELAEHTADGARQQRYFDAMRECRRKRAELERDFLRRARSLLQHPLQQPGQAPQHLSLLGDAELEESLAVTTMVAKAENQLARPLHALNQRFGFMLSRPELGDADNPIGPARLADAFHHATALLDMDTEGRLVVLKLFDRHVLGALEAVYSEVNIQLANADILPTLGAAAPRPVRRPPERPRPAALPPIAQAADADAEARMLAAALQLLARAAAPADGDGHASHAHQAGQGEPGLPASALLGALTRLQRQTAAGAPPERAAARSVKQQLLREAWRLGAGRGPLAPRDEHTIDLFGLLFEHVSHDDTLPRPLQPLLSRLHLPLLKAALADPGVLAQASHPARQLLDELGRAAVGWSASADPGQRLLARIQDTVDTLLGKFDGDTGMFERLLREFRGYTEASRRRAELSEQRAVEAALGRERLKLARQHVDAELYARTRERRPLPWLRQLLLRPWSNYLVLLWLRQGEASAAFQDALAFVDALLWCASAGGSDAERLRLRTLLPQLESQLRQGLSVVAYHDSEIDQLAEELSSLVRWRLGELPQPDFLDGDAAGQPALDAAPTAAANDGAIEDQPDPGSVDPGLLERIRETPPGTWFEFLPGGEPERAKLSWVSPLSGRCLFVNRSGLRVAELPPERVARDIEQGLARMLEGATLLQRALTAALGQLREARAGSQPPVGSDVA